MTIPHTFADKTISASLEELDNNFSYLSDLVGTGTNSFYTISVFGQSNVVAESSTDNLTLEAGAGILLTTNANTDTITITNAGIATNSFSTVSVSGESSIVANSTSNVLILASGTGISLSADPATNTITILNTGTGQVPPSNAASLNVSGNIAVSTTTTINSNGAIFTLNVTATRNVTTGNLSCFTGSSFRHIFANGNVISTGNSTFTSIFSSNIRTGFIHFAGTEPGSTTPNTIYFASAANPEKQALLGVHDSSSREGYIPISQFYSNASNSTVSTSHVNVLNPVGFFQVLGLNANSAYELSWHLYGTKSTTANTNFRIWLGNLFGSLNVAPQLAHVAVTGFTGASTTGFGVGTPIGASVSFRNTSPTDMELNILNGRFYLNFRAIVIINSTQDTYATFRANCSSGSLVVETGSYFQATKLPRTTSIGRYISWT